MTKSRKHNKSHTVFIAIFIAVLAVFGYCWMAQRAGIPKSTASSNEILSAQIAQATKYIVGKWKSTDDPKSLTVFSVDGTYTDTYANNPKDTSTGHWTIIPGSEDNNNHRYGDGISIFLIETANGSHNKSYFIIDTIDSETLSLVYVPKGNNLNFGRLE